MFLPGSLWKMVPEICSSFRNYYQVSKEQVGEVYLFYVPLLLLTEFAYMGGKFSLHFDTKDPDYSRIFKIYVNMYLSL